MTTTKCECDDREYPVHTGYNCSNDGQMITLYRVDMDDHTGTLFCDECAADALNSGLFYTEEEQNEMNLA